MRAQTYVILSILFIIIVAIFAVANVAPVQVNYLFWKGESPLILVILFSVLMGVLITAGAGFVKYMKLEKQRKQLQARTAQLESLLEEHGLLKEAEAEQNHGHG